MSFTRIIRHLIVFAFVAALCAGCGGHALALAGDSNVPEDDGSGGGDLQDPSDPPALIISGRLDSVDASGKAVGWAYDPADLSKPVEVRFYLDGGPENGGTLLGKAVANVARASLNTAQGITGDHAFAFTIPTTFRDGKRHAIGAYIVPLAAGSPLTKVDNSWIPICFNATVPLAIGAVDTIDGQGNIRGWAADASHPGAAVTVHIYVDGVAGTGVFAGAVDANIARPDLNSVLGWSGNHGFSFAIPAQFRDGLQHSIFVYGLSQATGATPSQLPGAGKVFNLVATGPRVIGWVDTIDSLGVVRGWAIDASDPNRSVTAHFYVDTLTAAGFAGATDATIADAGLDAYLGYSGNHRFAFTIPQAYRDGKAHTIYVFGLSFTVGVGNPVLPNSPMSFQIH